ncbi:MAG: MiaB/RimO family radical SAM methylthiotransferase, partial [Oscillospiraceae bacterium]
IENVPIRREDKFVAWVPIMYGCNNFCSYCIVPYVRGRERSRRSADIFTEVENLVKNGYKEITLLGQNVNSYGKGLEENIDFSDLLNLLCKIKGDYLIRFMTSHPKDATFKLIDTIAQNEHIAKNLHLPVQSGSDRILALMNRKYTRKDYMSLVNYAKEKIKDVTFSSDIIVGFPGETQEDFNETLSLVKEVSYTQLFTFIYSKRTGTKAAQFPDDTPQKEKSQRIMRLKEIQETATHNMFNKLVGTQQKILVTAVGRNANTFCGRLTNNCLVEFENKDDTVKLGDFTQVKITDTRNSVLIGQLIL